MSLSQIRGYFNTQILATKPTYQEWLDAFNVENIPRPIIDRTYHIEIGTDSSTQGDVSIEDEVTVSVSIFKQAFNSPVTARDDLLDIAHCIRLALIKPLNVEAYKVANSGDIDTVTSSSITAIEIDDSNDNIVKAELIFNVRLYFCSTK